MPKFKIFTDQGKQFIECLDFPRFTGEITFGETSDIENIVMHDQCNDVMLLAKTMREAGNFILSQNK